MPAPVATLDTSPQGPSRDLDYWARLHVTSDRSAPITLRDVGNRGYGKRTWRGGWLREDRL